MLVSFALAVLGDTFHHAEKKEEFLNKSKFYLNIV